MELIGSDWFKWNRKYWIHFKLEIILIRLDVYIPFLTKWIKFLFSSNWPMFEFKFSLWRNRSPHPTVAQQTKMHKKEKRSEEKAMELSRMQFLLPCVPRVRIFPLQTRTVTSAKMQVAVRREKLFMQQKKFEAVTRRVRGRFSDSMHPWGCSLILLIDCPSPVLSPCQGNTVRKLAISQFSGFPHLETDLSQISLLLHFHFYLFYCFSAN